MYFHRVFVAAAFFVLACLPLGCGGWFELRCDQNLPDGVPGSCPKETSPDGTSQGRCRPSTSGQMCDPGLTCIDGVCIPCGLDGESCCFHGINIPRSCDPGIACDASDNFPWPTCTASCGAVGKPCCDIPFDPCPAGGICGASNTCEGNASSGCGTGTQHFAWIIDANRCASKPMFFLAPAGSEESCAQAALAAFPGFTLGPIDTDATCKDVCVVPSVNAPNDLDLCWFSDEDYNTCAKSFCIFDDQCTWNQKACAP